MTGNFKIKVILIGLLLASLLAGCGRLTGSAPAGEEEKQSAKAKNNLVGGGELDLGTARLRITNVSEASASPVFNDAAPDGKKYILVEMEVADMPEQTWLRSGSFALVMPDGTKIAPVKAYGDEIKCGIAKNVRLTPPNPTQAFEAEVCEIYAPMEPGEKFFNVMFEVDQDFDLGEANLVYQ
jgi:hypothetical protein